MTRSATGDVDRALYIYIFDSLNTLLTLNILSTYRQPRTIGPWLEDRAFTRKLFFVCYIVCIRENVNGCVCVLLVNRIRRISCMFHPQNITRHCKIRRSHAHENTHARVCWAIRRSAYFVGARGAEDVFSFVRRTVNTHLILKPMTTPSTVPKSTNGRRSNSRNWAHGLWRATSHFSKSYASSNHTARSQRDSEMRQHHTSVNISA